MRRDDPTATYRGYRRQALYALFRLFDEALADDFAIQPEGVEDLAIFDNTHRLVEVVQVKDYTSNLTASSFKPFFYERISSLYASNSALIVRVASFGSIGPDLLAAKVGDPGAKARVVATISQDREVERTRADGTTETITKAGLPVAQATHIIEHLELQQVTEVTLTDAILTLLTRSVVGVSPRDAFDFLMWWMLTSAESQRTIRRRDAIQKLTRVAQFLEGRSAFHSEWYRSIVPLSDAGANPAPEARSKLQREFFRGGRVRFDHIMADVDVPRTVPLTKIHEAFFESNIVIVHSASGQGKTTLALRYLKELAPTSFRLQLESAEGLKHARQMALAIREHAQAIAVPTLVFVDVRPGDSYWVELVRQLWSEPLMRILVTIREEDWQRSNVSGSDFLFSEISLDFDEPEARSLYQSLREQELATKHIDFEEAWSQFGVRKSLLEFVYFLTQAETLTQRIKAQVRAFQDEVRIGKADPNEESLLRLVAVASTYEARLYLTRTITQCRIASPVETVRRFENEYFIRESHNGRLLDGFHAIRSGVLSECLTDPSLFSWGETAAQALPLMEEGDLEAFLLCAFSRREDTVPELLNSLDAFEPATWSGVCGVMRALMWLGVRAYWNSNRAVVDDAFAQNPGCWFLMLEWDVAHVLGDKGWNIFENLGAAGAVAAARSKELRDKLTDSSTVFAPVRNWLSSRQSVPTPPKDQRDWMSVAEVMFWCGNLGIESSLDSSVDCDTLSQATASLPLYRLGEFMRGLRERAPEVGRMWLSQCRGSFVERIRREAAIAKLDESEESVVAHYLIAFDSEESRLRRPHQRDDSKTASSHDLTIERVELLSQLFANKQKYGAVGYGHRLSVLPFRSDEANKPGVLGENLHPQWATRLNGLSRGHCEYRFRPANWREFFARLTELREQVLSCFVDLRATVARSRREPIAQSFIHDTKKWDECRKAFNAGLLFPKSAVDEWGYITESAESVEHAPSQSERQASVTRFGDLHKAIREFTRTVSNFLTQAPEALILVPLLRKATSASHRQQILGHGLQVGVNENSIRLSVINGCDAFSAVMQLHAEFESVESLFEYRNHALANRERREFLETMEEWASFVFPPKQAHHEPTAVRREPFYWVLRPIRNRLKNNLQSLRRMRIVAKILPGIVVWDGKPGLWITANADHPVTSMSALALVWNAIWESFGRQTTNPLPFCATRLAWEEIVVALTVDNRSLGRQVYRQFKAAAFRDEPSLHGMHWALVPEQVPPEVWEQVEIECWESSFAMSVMDRFVASYGVLLQHVQHIADFSRVPDTDELGVSILQEYLGHESNRAEHLLTATYDVFTELLKLSSSLGDLNESPNLVAAVQALLELKAPLSLNPNEFSESNGPTTHKLSIEDIVDWRNRLTKGSEGVGLARLFLAAHTLGCSALSK